MQKLLFVFILFFSFINLFSQEEKFQKKKSEQALNDTLKTKLLSETEKSSSIDTTKTIKPQKLIPLVTNNVLTSKENILTGNVLQKLDMRYTGDYFSHVPFGFVRDLGSVGQPNEVVIWGNGFKNSSYLMDGVNINNRLTNAKDLNLFQSESIDSIEIIPLPQGFLFNEMNNPVTVNFSAWDLVTSKPYTRIRFYQAPNEEGFFDGIFSSSINRQLSLISELTHQSTDPRFKNSDYGMWAGSVRLMYIVNNDLNIIGRYNYYQNNVQLNGGVDVDSIKKLSTLSSIEEILFSTIQAPVNYIDRYQKVSGNNINVKFLANIIGTRPTDLTFYYQSSLIEFRQNEHTNTKNDIWRWDSTWRNDKIIHNNSFNTYGTKLSQRLGNDFINIYSEVLYESTLLDTPLLKRDDKINTFSAMSKASLLLQNEGFTFTPTIYGKFLNYDGKSYLGGGADISWLIGESYTIYLGFSKFQRPPNHLVNYDGLYNKSDVNIIEAKLSLKNSNVNFSSGYFLQEYKINSNSNKRLQGINLKLDWQLWKLLLSTNTNYYFIQENKDNFPLPDFTSNGGIYYIDTLFNDNLKLKAGINYWLFGDRGFQYINFETFEVTKWIKNGSNIISPSLSVKPSVQFDFFVAGKIQDAATIYFVFENLLNEKYYIVPYYPKQERGIRLGVAWEFID